VKGWVDLLLSVMAAAATALLLALIARDDIGMPPHMIREDALVAAGIMVAVVAAISWRKPKQRL
jgi:4-amino-4-deoxy-L-arabinose transferase-like glycosyltransferase